MYNQVSSTNATAIATLPRNSTEIIGQRNYDYLDMSMKQSSNSRIAPSNIDDKDIKKETRPTYGAYTMPRGPYLQYKYNDRQTNSTTTNTIAANRANNYYNDNNHQQKRQIEKLKNEFIHLPRARICPTGTTNSGCSGSAGSNGDTDQTDYTSGNSNGLIQTLGRYKPHANRHNEIQGISNSEYFLNSQTLQSNADLNAYGNFNYYAIVENRLNANRNAQYIANANHNIPYNQQDQLYDADAISYERIDSKGNDFLQHLQTKNLHLLSSAASGRTSGNGAVIPGYYRSASSASGDNVISARINYVTLAEVVKIKTVGLSQTEGWALLCQSVQALQDLFLSDTPSTTKVLPLVHPSSLQITSRGRVVFNMIPSGQMNPVNDVASHISFLSPEYLSSIGKKITFVESDIEKMWIYSLGVTLRRTIQSTTASSASQYRNGKYDAGIAMLQQQNGGYENDGVAQVTANKRPPEPITQQNHHRTAINGHVNHLGNDNDAIPTTNNVYKHLTSLDFVIRMMCAPNLHYRASLMYLLDAISQYCRYYHQIKPFSHIGIELFKEVVNKLTTNDQTLAKSKKSKSSNDLLSKYSDDHKSDTDSGRSSTHGDKEFLASGRVEHITKSVNQLKVTRCTEEKLKLLFNSRPSDQRLNEKNSSDEAKEREPFSTNRLQVVRRKDAILKRRNMHRRNTIDVNLHDMQKAVACQQFENKLNPNASKSTNCIDKIDTFPAANFANRIDAFNSNGASMPDLSKANRFATLPALRVRRRSRVIIGNNSSDEESLSSSTSKPRGPEFILNSSLPSQEIDISEPKCQHRRPVTVLLLNGRSLSIHCNSATATSRQILTTVIKTENYIENYFLGLCAIIGGDFVFLPSDLRIYKVAPTIWGNFSKKPNVSENVNFTLFLRIKFFLPSLRGISSLESRHLLYLQLRKSVLESQILCTDDDLISLGGLAIQSEVGDFQQTMKVNDYFTISHYLPEGVYQRNKEMAKYLRNSHFCKRGLHSRDAEQQFIRYIQEMKEYGLHLYSAIWAVDNNISYDVYVAISLNGISIFERSPRICADKQIECGKNPKTTFQRKLYASFDWLEIENLCFSKHILCVVVRKAESLKAKDNNRIKYKFKMDGRKSYFAFSLASEHHKFYMKLRDSFISLKHISDELNIPLAIINLSPSECQVSDIHLSDFENDRPKSAATVPNSPENVHENVKIIDKQTKSTGLRVRNLKKSMMNDNKLTKLRNKFLKRSKSSAGICPNNLDEKTKSIGNSKEEYQNKENELPKDMCDEQILPKVMSPNRNRVKMGTRVFSSQFLNKSFDNIYDNALDVYHIDDIDDAHHSFLHGKQNQPIERFDANTKGQCNSERDTMEDGSSLRSTSMNSLYFSEKMSEKFSESPLPSEAYVIHSSIKSTSEANFFSLQNETVSDTLLDKFNNISTNNTISDRIITRVIIRKDKPGSKTDNKKQMAQYQKNDGQQQIKYATMNNRNRSATAKDLYWSKSQESIFTKSSSQLCVRRSKAAFQRDHARENGHSSSADGLTLGISIVQGSDNNVYVKDLVKNGPGAQAGIQVGDQILSVNGISLLNLPYDKSLRMLQNTGTTVEMVVSQIFSRRSGMEHRSSNSTHISQSQEDRNSMKNDDSNRADALLPHTNVYSTATSQQQQQRIENKFIMKDEYENVPRNYGHNRMRTIDESQMITAKSMPDLPKVVAIIPKHTTQMATMPKSTGHSRKYQGPMKFPVTPIRTSITTDTKRLSLLADDDEHQVYI